MPRTDRQPSEDSEGAEFRSLCARLQWDAPAFARAANIRERNAKQMWDGERHVPDNLMDWLRTVVASARKVPPPPRARE